MSPERQESQPGAYQRFLPGFQEAWEEARRNAPERGRVVTAKALEVRKPGGAMIEAMMARLTRLQKGLEEESNAGALEGKGPFTLKEAAKFLAKIAKKSGSELEGYPSHSTLEKLLKIATVLGHCPLPAGAIKVNLQGRWSFALTGQDLLTTLASAREVLEKRGLSVEEALRQTKQIFEEERRKRTPIENLVPPILQRLGRKVSEWRETQILKLLFEKLQKGNLLSPEGIRSQEILILGLPPGKEAKFISAATKLIRKEGKPLPLREMPALTGFLREQLGELLKVNPRYVVCVVVWLETEGIPVTPRRGGRKETYPTTSYRLSPEAQEQLKSLLASPEKRERLLEILQKGFTLEEIKAHLGLFPQDFHLSVNEVYRLARGKGLPFCSKSKGLVVEILRKNGIPLKEERAPNGSPLHKIPLLEVERAVNLLRETSTSNQEQI